MSQTIEAVDSKGNKHRINWSLLGNDIYKNNTGNVGIGTQSPNNLLEIEEGTTGNSGLRFTNLINAPILATDGNGDVIQANTPLGTVDVNSFLGFDSGGNLVIGSADDAYWTLNGNPNATGTNFLGTTNDVRFSIISNNTTMFEIGRRETLGLYDTSSTGLLFPYNEPDASVTYIRGASGVSALQFEASGAAFYKPLLFTDSDGNFVMRGSSAGTDFFELGSAGSANNGSFIFTIADDGDEPIIFRKFNYTTQSYVEMMRLQGTGLNDQVRVGVNVDGNQPSSTLQVNGSTATAITTTTGNLTLTDEHASIILGGNHTITLPAANTCTGRTYIIKNPTTNEPTISSYLGFDGSVSTSIEDSSVIHLQSDGTNWQQLSYGRLHYEKIVIWAEENGALANGEVEYSYGNGATGFIGIPLPEQWEAYAVSFQADNSGAADSVEIGVGDISANNTFTELFNFTASGGDANNMNYTELLTTPVDVPAGTVIGFRTNTETGTVSDARVAVWLRRLP